MSTFSSNIIVIDANGQPVRGVTVECLDITEFTPASPDAEEHIVATGTTDEAGEVIFSSLDDTKRYFARAQRRGVWIQQSAPAGYFILKSLLTTRGDMIRRGASTPERFAKGTSGKFLEMGADDPDWEWDEVGISYVIDGGGSVISTGVAGGLEVPFNCFVTGWTITATDGLTGAIVVDVWADTYANYPPTVADTIAGSEKPTITATGNKGQDLTLTTWTQALTKGDCLFFNVDSVATLTRVTVSLRVDKRRAS